MSNPELKITKNCTRCLITNTSRNNVVILHEKIKQKYIKDFTYNLIHYSEN